MSDDTGNVTAINRYDEYGIADAANASGFGYAGQRTTFPALNHDQARFYQPGSGTFAQPDPIGAAGDGPNLYAYVLNDPVNKSDPLGLAWPDNPCPYIDGQIVCTGSSGPDANEIDFDNRLRWDSFWQPVGGGDMIVTQIGVAGSGTFTATAKPKQGLCPTGALAKWRENAKELAKWSGGAGAVLELAGAIPTPATPVLEGLGVTAIGTSRLAAGAAIGVDIIYGLKTGQLTALKYDAIEAFVAEIPLGTAGDKINRLSHPDASASKFGQKLGNGGMFAVSLTLPNPCG
jgi:RHS repeat-associated protein